MTGVEGARGLDGEEGGLDPRQPVNLTMPQYPGVAV